MSEARFVLLRVVATGPDPKTDGVVHLAGLRISDRTPPELGGRAVDPDRSIPRAAYLESGVNKETASHALSLDRVLDDWLRPFLDGTDAVFVRGEEQRKWTVHVLGDRSVRVVDLDRLVQFALPDVDSGDPDVVRSIGKTFGLDKRVGEEDFRSYRGRDGVEKREPRLPSLRALSESAGLLKRVVDRFLEGGDRALLTALLGATFDRMGASKGALAPFAALADLLYAAPALKWTRGDLFAGVVHPRFTASVSPPPAGEVRPFLLPGTETAERPANEERVSTEPVRPQAVRDAFTWLRSEAKLEPRPAQDAYAAFAAKAMSEGGVFALEGGTGTGKTLGYLIPALLYAKANPGAQVFVATATKTLQGQLVSAEIPRLTRRGGLFGGMTAAVLKGRSNYLCAGALLDEYPRCFADSGSVADRLSWIHLYLVATRAEGETEAVRPESVNRKVLWALLEEVRADRYCGRECSGGPDCIPARAEAAALRANVVVANHHKLALLPSVFGGNGAVCVVDEADRFPDNARSAWGREIAERDLRRMFVTRFRGRRQRRGAIEVVEEVGEGIVSPSDLGAIEAGVNRLEDLLARPKQILNHKLYPGDGALAEQRWRSMRPDQAKEELVETLVEIAGTLRTLSSRWVRVADVLKGEAGPRASAQKRAARYAEELEEAAGAVERIVKAYPTDDQVHTFELGRGRSWCVRAVPYRIGKDLEEHVHGRFRAMLYTSATLYVSEETGHFRHELDRAEPFTNELRVGSPFDYEKQCCGAILGYLPKYDYRAPDEEKERWEASVAKAIVQLSVAMNGRTLVLFTSTRDMERAYERAAPAIEQHEIVALLQQGTGAYEADLFRRTVHSVLFGVDRFWTGVDFPGETLSLVVIVRAPNPNLSAPLVEHRQHVLGDRFWETYYEPTARLKLRQGFGRLIRRESDSGGVVVLDSRFAGASPTARQLTELPLVLDVATTYRRRDGEDVVDLDRVVRRLLATTGRTPEFEARGLDLYDLDRTAHSAETEGALHGADGSVTGATSVLPVETPALPSPPGT